MSGAARRFGEREREAPAWDALTSEFRPDPAGSVEPGQPAGDIFELVAARMEAVAAHAGIDGQQGTASLIGRSIHAELTRVSRLARAAALLHQADPPQRHIVV